MESIYKVEIENVLSLVDTCRYLAASAAYSELIHKIDSSNITPDIRDSILGELSTNNIIKSMLERVERIQSSLHFVDESDDWILGADMFGIQTHYRKCVDDPNAIIVKIEGAMDDLPLFEQMAVLHEIDLYHEWAPFCTDSVLVDKIGKAELYGYVCVGLPVFSRDLLFHAFGADCMEEHGKVVILGKSVEPEEYPGDKEVPWKSCGWLHKRMYIQDLEAIVEATSPTAAKMKIISRVDLNAPLPHSLINFLIRKLAGVLLYMIQKQTIKVKTDHHCSHALRIRSNQDFYKDWLLPKLRHYCDQRGWEQPTINSLGEDGIPPPTSVDPVISHNNNPDPRSSCNHTATADDAADAADAAASTTLPTPPPSTAATVGGGGGGDDDAVAAVCTVSASETSVGSEIDSAAVG